MRRHFACATAFVLAAFGECAAHAADITAQLDYASTSDCPASADFEEVVADHLGYSPFQGGAPQHVLVRIETSGRGLEGLIQWQNEKGGWAGDRTFPSRSNNCVELVQAMGFAIALQFQLLAAAQTDLHRPGGSPGADHPPPDVAPAPTLSVSPTATDSRQQPSRSGLSAPAITAGIGAAAGVGLSPNLGAVGRLYGTLSWPHVAVELAAEASVPSTLHRADGAGFSQQVLLAGLAGCGLNGRWSICLLGKVGEIRVAGEGVDTPGTLSRLFLQTGLRLGLTQALGRRAQLAVHGDGLASLTRGIVTLDSMPVWTTPRIAAAVGLDFGVRFQ
jgi:hypothetical protein